MTCPNAVRNLSIAVVEDALAQLFSTTEERGDFRHFDRDFREIWLRKGEELFAGLADEVGRRLRNSQASCPTCGDSMRFKQMRPLQLRTTLTGVPETANSPYFICDRCHSGRLVLRDALGLDREGMTPALRERAVLAGTIEPFESASESLLKDLAGITVSGSAIHELCGATGAKVEEVERKGELGQARSLRPDETLYVMVDGGMAHIDGGWHEVKLAVIFPSSGRAEVSCERGELTERQVVTTTGDRHELGRMVWAAVRRWMPAGALNSKGLRKHVQFISDGAVWTRNLAEEYLPGARILLDWYHASEHLAAAAKALYGEGIAARRWRQQVETWLLAGETNKGLGHILRYANMPKRKEESRTALLALYKYLNDRRALLDYDRARTAGRHIGSGAIESAVGHVMQQRMKRAGMRWDWPGAKAMLALRAAYRSTSGWACVAALV